ncbi:hypothetical protein [Saccharothrix sp. HUAS TT1]|uniref:hypothetical protein n=1 Tax=unclassified Saccharothrix TaxID=2593673 RepID=UPI00345C1032
MAGRQGHAVHRSVVVVDVAGFGDPARTLPHQVTARKGLYAVVAGAFEAAGVPWEACYHEDRGDGAVVLVPPEFPKSSLVEVLPEALVRAVRGHNNTSHESARLRLRVAVHAGEVVFDGHGITSTSLTTAFRLVDAPPFKRALADSPGVVAVIVSRAVFDEVVRHSAVLDPATFRPVEVAVKEVRETAWVALPDHPWPAAPPPDPDETEVELAGRLVEAMASGRADLAEDVAALLRRAGATRGDRVAAEVDRSTARLRAARGSDREREVTRQEAAWEVILRDLLADHPEAAAELRALAARGRNPASGAPVVTTYRQDVAGGAAGAQGPGATAIVNNHHAPNPTP